MAASKGTEQQTPADRLEAAVNSALAIARKAKKAKKSLSSDNFYANRLLQLRADATNTFHDLSAQSAGDATAMAELIQAVFSAKSTPAQRLQASRDLIYSLRTTWRQPATPGTTADRSLFPSSILDQTGRGYLISIGRQMNGAFSQGWHDAAAVMMRRFLEMAIIEAFEAKTLSSKITDKEGNYLHLSELVDAALGEPSFKLSRNAKKYLPRLRDLGHLSAHGRYYTAREEDLENVQQGCRVVIEELLTIAGLV